MTRDISMVVPKKILVGQIEEVIEKNGGAHLESYKLFDLYEGAQIKAGFKSVALKLPALPYAYPKIKQSTLYIDNLCELVRLIIENGETGLFMPQDKMAVSAVELLTAIIESMGKKISKSRLLGLGIYLLSFLPIVKKAYGGVAYSEKMTAYYDNRYVVVDFKEGIRRTLK